MNKLDNARIYATMMEVAKNAPDEIESLGDRPWDKNATDLDKYTGGYENGIFDVTMALVNANMITNDQHFDILNAMDGDGDE